MSEGPVQHPKSAVPTPVEAAPPEAAPAQHKHGWHKLLIAMLLITRGVRAQQGVEGSLGGDGNSLGWTVLWVAVALGVAFFAVSEWEILRAAKWQMRPVQWICMGLFHIAYVGFLLYLCLR
ncbi:hypothetical protein [Streptomyces sp. NPDC058964]|uniref:hypothetical protein n=1 Tax=Streptomyces sp. NPDC058964 TaxID=3346681 RepID=UPI0036CA6ABD